jgi:hypothetical protein
MRCDRAGERQAAGGRRRSWGLLLAAPGAQEARELLILPQQPLGRPRTVTVRRQHTHITTHPSVVRCAITLGSWPGAPRRSTRLRKLYRLLGCSGCSPLGTATQ